MYFHLIDPLPDLKSNSIIIEEVKSDLTKWIQPINEGFKIKAGDNSYQKLNEMVMRKIENKFRHFITYYKNELAASGTLFLSQDTVMLHNLATKNNFKKLGIGTTLTLYMMEQAKNMGFQHCFLDSSLEAFNLYKKIGFNVYSHTLIYRKN